MAITKNDVLARFAEFGTIQDPEWTAVLADAALQVNSSVWGTKSDLATIYLTAHLLGCAHPNLVPRGRVTLQSMDGVAYRYAGAETAPAADNYESTPYGRLFISLRRQIAMGRVVVP